MNLKPMFGLEIHIELETNTKAFSNSKVSFSEEPNSQINSIDLAYPGSKPTVNKAMVEYAFILAKALQMNIEHEIRFDRKNYFYPDLSKGFQITQFLKPIGISGKFPLINEKGESKYININEIHIEEDTAKQIKEGEITKFDFNRAGIALIEVVTDFVDFDSIDEVINFVNQFREFVKLLGISDAKLENGSIRIDVNISLKNLENNKIQNRVEIKNLNSIINIRKALEYEINFQKETYENDQLVKEETKRWDEENEELIVMRRKDGEEQYHYIPETNILPITLTKELIDLWNFKFEKKELSFKKRKLFLDNGLNDKEIKTIFSFPLVYSKLLEAIINNEEGAEAKKYFSFLFIRIQGILNIVNASIYDLDITRQHIIDLYKLSKSNKISNDILKEIILEISEKQLDVLNINEKIEKYKQVILISDKELKIIIIELIKENQEQVNKFKSNPKRLSSFLVGMVMKKTKGKIDPKKANSIINEVINE